MKAKSWKEAFEAVGLIAIIASLAFVGFQLNQDRVIARAELTSDSFQLIYSVLQRLTEPEIAKTFVNMLDRPEELSLDEKVQIDNLFRSVNILYLRVCYLKGRGILGECDAIIQATAQRFFGNRYGQSWWRLYGTKGAENNELVPFPDWVETEIENFDPNEYRHMLDETNTEN